MLVAVDTGGTFTDFYCLDEKEIRIHKVISTPDDPSRAIVQGLRQIGFENGEIVHGSTVATNALLEHKGARVALITTTGFEDVIAPFSQKRYVTGKRGGVELVVPGATFKSRVLNAR